MRCVLRGRHTQQQWPAGGGGQGALHHCTLWSGAPADVPLRHGRCLCSAWQLGGGRGWPKGGEQSIGAETFSGIKTEWVTVATPGTFDRPLPHSSSGAPTAASNYGVTATGRTPQCNWRSVKHTIPGSGHRQQQLQHRTAPVSCAERGRQGQVDPEVLHRSHSGQGQWQPGAGRQLFVCTTQPLWRAAAGAPGGGSRVRRHTGFAAAAPSLLPWQPVAAAAVGTEAVHLIWCLQLAAAGGLEVPVAWHIWSRGWG
jgi:hypothetical protein